MWIVRQLIDTSVEPPEPTDASTLDDLVDRLRRLKIWAGDPSYEEITRRVRAALTAAGRPAAELPGKTTVVDLFRSGRRRLDAELTVVVVSVLRSDPGYLFQWRQALRVIGGEILAAAQVRVRDALPPDPTGFVGRTAELDRIRDAVHAGGPAVAALRGMAGVGKTRLAVHLGHRLAGDRPFDHVLFVDLRGFHPDPAQTPADPAAVLDGFLRLLGMSGRQVPHRPAARAQAYRDRLAGTRSLILLDNAADEDQVRLLLPGTPGCVTLVTSRRGLTGLTAATHVDVDVFTPAESHHFLTTAVPGVAAGADRDAADRIARRCGHLPLALVLVAGHIGAKPGWTLTDHAERLDERHDAQRLETDIELALEVSYRNLPAGVRELLRLLAQHPGVDIDAYAAAAMSGTDPDTAGARLRELGDVHLAQSDGTGRYGLHDLVRAYAAARATDEDRRAEREAAITRLLDYYLAAAAAAMNRLDPGGAGRRPAVPPSPVALPDLTDPVAWLEAERANLVAAVTRSGDDGRTGYAVTAGAVLYRYLLGGHHLDALTVHGRAVQAAERSGDQVGCAGALVNLSTAEVLLGRHEAALAHLEQARRIFSAAGDTAGQARTLNNLGIAETRLGRYQDAARHLAACLDLHRRAADRAGLARALTNLGNLESRMGRDDEAIEHYADALRLYRATGDRAGEAGLLANLGEAEIKQRSFDQAEQHLTQALELYRELRDTASGAAVLDIFGVLHTNRGHADRAAGYHGEALTLFRRLGNRHGEACAHNGLGEAAQAAGRPTDAISEHRTALGIATGAEVADLEQQARAHTGLAQAHRSGDDPTEAARHYQLAENLWTELNSPEADRVAALRTTLNHP